MFRNRQLSRAGALLVALALAGCSGYGTIKFLGWEAGRKQVWQMVESFQDYHLYSSGMSTAYPSGLIFDPKGDETRIEPGVWAGVNSQGLAELLVRNLERYQNYKPKLYALIGDDGRRYGFIYTGYKSVVVQQVAENAVSVGEMSEPPHLKYDQNGDIFDPGMK